MYSRYHVVRHTRTKIAHVNTLAKPIREAICGCDYVVELGLGFRQWPISDRLSAGILVATFHHSSYRDLRESIRHTRNGETRRSCKRIHIFLCVIVRHNRTHVVRVNGPEAHPPSCTYFGSPALQTYTTDNFQTKSSSCLGVASSSDWCRPCRRR